jgi:hypothetical protein
VVSLHSCRAWPYKLALDTPAVTSSSLLDQREYQCDLDQPSQVSTSEKYKSVQANFRISLQ